MASAFFPSRWRRVLQGIAAFYIVGSVLRLTLGEGSLPWLGSLAWALFGVALVVRSRRVGVTVSDSGLRVRSATPFGAAGSWKWSELQSMQRFWDASVKDGPEQLGLRTTSGELIRIGPTKRHEPLILALRSRLEEESATTPIW